MNLKLSKNALDIFNTFSKTNYQIFLVGGAVRDLLMDKGANDLDFTTDAKPEEILKLFPTSYYTNKFGTVGIPKGKSIIEITTMRKEGDYKDHRHPVEVSWTDKINEDLARRDFTVNAMALSPKLELVDPYLGQTDLNEGIIRAVGNPDLRFKEDALRLIRAIRFSSQLGFEIEKNTFEAISKNKEGIKDISGERIQDELFKLLSSTNPYIGLVKLREAGILQIILPELEACFGIVQEGPKHDRMYDIGEHSFSTLNHTPSTDPAVRLAALLHDIGKVETFKKDSSGNVTFYNHDLVGANIFREISQRLKLSKKQSDKIYKLIRYHMFSVDENQTDSAIRRFIRNVGVDNIDDMLALRVGDRLGGGTATASSWRMEKFRERITQVMKKPFSITDLKINGQDVMNELKIPPSRKVGEVLQKLFEEVLNDSSKNTREYLLPKIKLVT